MKTTSLTAAAASGLRRSSQASSVISSGVRRQMLRYDVFISLQEPSASRRIGACLSQKAAIAASRIFSSFGANRVAMRLQVRESEHAAEQGSDEATHSSTSSSMESSEGATEGSESKGEPARNIVSASRSSVCRHNCEEACARRGRT